MASPESILQTIQNYIRSLDSKKGKDVAMTPTGVVTAPKEDILPGGGSSIPQDTIPKPNYPDAPKRTVAPITDDIPTAGTSASLAASTAAKMLKQQRNLEAMNEETEQKGWYEQMRDASDVYKADIGLDRDKKRYDYMMERDAAKAALEAEKIAQRGDIASDRAAIEREKITSREATAKAANDIKLEMAKYKNDNSFRAAFNDKINEIMARDNVTYDTKTQKPNLTPEQIKEAAEYAGIATGKAIKTTDPNRGVYADLAQKKFEKSTTKSANYNAYSSALDKVLAGIDAKVLRKAKYKGDRAVMNSIKESVIKSVGGQPDYETLDALMYKNGFRK